MIKIQNSKPIYDRIEKKQPDDLVIGYWNLRFICILVLGI